MSSPLLSICIPTYGRTEILCKTLESIFSQNVDFKLVEVCISDNSPTDETKEMLEAFFSDNVNIRYKKSTCEGYYNSIEALKLGSGKYLKLHNNYSKIKKGMLGKILNFLSKQEEAKPVIFFSSASKNTKEEKACYNSFDDFLNAVSYYSTWSTAFGIWKENFDSIIRQNIELDKMFPHTSLLFSLCDKRNFIVDNAPYFENQDVGKKGGYNIPETFGTRYLGMCEALFLEQKISEQTFSKIKSGILQFIAEWYVNVKYFGNKYTFSYENWEITVKELYGDSGIDFVKNFAKKRRLKCIVKKILGKY